MNVWECVGAGEGRGDGRIVDCVYVGGHRSSLKMQPHKSTQASIR